MRQTVHHDMMYILYRSITCIYTHEDFEHNILHKKILLSQFICHLFPIEGTSSKDKECLLNYFFFTMWCNNGDCIQCKLNSIEGMWIQVVNSSRYIL